MVWFWFISAKIQHDLPWLKTVKSSTGFTLTLKRELVDTNAYKLQPSLSIIHFAKHFQNFIDDTLICFLNSKLDLNLSCAKDFLNLISMGTWCIN